MFSTGIAERDAMLLFLNHYTRKRRFARKQSRLKKLRHFFVLAQTQFPGTQLL